MPDATASSSIAINSGAGALRVLAMLHTGSSDVRAAVCGLRAALLTLLAALAGWKENSWPCVQHSRAARAGWRLSKRNANQESRLSTAG